MSGIVGSKLNIRGSGTVAKLGTDGQHLLSSGAGKSAEYETIASATYDDNKLQMNMALLGFKVAINGALAKYDLVDQTIDDFQTTAAVDAGASTNEGRTETADESDLYYYEGRSGANPVGGNRVDTSITGYRAHVFTSDGSFVVTTGGDVDILVVAGGGSGGQPSGGGGGAGGLIYKTGHALTTNTYDAVIGAGGGGCVPVTASCRGGIGEDTTWTINGGSVEFTAKGGGSAGYENTDGHSAMAGGSAAARGYNGAGGTQTQTSQSGDSGTYGFGGNGGSGAWQYNSGGGGGSGGAGGNASAGGGGAGGIGKDFSAIYGTVVGDSGWFASGGAGPAQNGSQGTASAGGGTNPSGNVDVADNTGGGSGGGNQGNPGTGDGGSGVVIARYAVGEFVTHGLDLTLQSTDTTATTADPDYGDLIILMEDGEGTATLNTDIKGYVSEDSGSTFTEGVLVNEGSWGTNKKVVAFHDLDISAQSGSAMCYKITTHNQSAGSKETYIHSVSLGWR